MKAGSVVVFLLMAGLHPATMRAQQALHSFPQHADYFRNVIFPSSFSRQILDDSTASFYDQWKNKYIRHDDCSKSLYVEYSDKPNGYKCVSEGQGYGMIITAYMAGYDKHAQQIFDSLYKYYSTNLSDYPSVLNRKFAYLMSWRQNSNCKKAPDAVSDGDLDIMYALLLANAQWGSGGKINYLQEAKRMNKAVLMQEINKETFTVLKGNAVEPKDPDAPDDKGSKDYYDMRSSDFMPAHFKIFATAFNDSTWKKVTDSCYNLFAVIQRKYSPDAGLIPDFIVNVKDPKPAKPFYEEERSDGDYAHNACRVPWRIATDYLLTGDMRSKSFLDKLNVWAITSSSRDVNNIAEGYHLSGKPIKGTEDFPVMSYVCPFAVAAMTGPKHQQWLNSLTDYILKNPISKPKHEKAEGKYDYYNNTIKMLTLIILSGNYWSPGKQIANSF